MFHGRISEAVSTGGNLCLKANKIANHLNKLHDFRINQGNLKWCKCWKKYLERIQIAQIDNVINI
ncbi:hypothetical protein JCM21531_2867 [Acetivibrio straminisolvens JCM 21531]|jgi:hypothetical protein|uniref:Uncharacterized protein n=1 Tax=Acetivibrio straminisolvens JCM 21531 TaxID=1294263 RepID=W4V7J5_9FIRM|nr:hypothetical protein JCM21531_2867 [Acetivibrio straminisolvens JCM 21531]